jgi:cell division septation protein DedD
VVLLGAIGWGVSRLGPRAVPVVEADPGPVRVKPQAPDGREAPSADERVFDRPAERRAEPAVPVPRPAQQRPEQAPADRQQQATRAETAAPPRPAPSPARPAPAATGRWQAQLGALNSEAGARAAWDRLTKQVPALQGYQPAISRLEREGQSPLWRLRVAGLADAAAARALCEQVRDKGGACLPVAP